MQETINRTKEEIEVGMIIQGKRIDILRFLDDFAITIEKDEPIAIYSSTDKQHLT